MPIIMRSIVFILVYCQIVMPYSQIHDFKHILSRTRRATKRIKLPVLVKQNYDKVKDIEADITKIKLFMQKIREEELNNRLHDVQDLASQLQTKVEGNEVAVEKLKTNDQDYQEKIEQLEQQYKVVSRENGLLRSKIQNITMRVVDLEKQQAATDSPPSFVPVLVTESSNPFLMEDDMVKSSLSVEDIDAIIIEKYPVLQKISSEWINHVNTSIENIEQLTQDLTENIVPQLENTNREASEQRVEVQSELKELQLDFTRVKNKLKSEITEVKQTVGNFKSFKTEFQKLRNRTNKISERANQIDEKFDELNSTIQENNSGQGMIELDESVELSGGFPRVLESHLENSDTVVLDDSKTPEPLVDSTEFDEIKESITLLKESLEFLGKLNQTVISQSQTIKTLSGKVRVSNNALKIANLSDIFTEKFETLSNSIDTRLSLFHPAGPDADDLAHLCDYVPDFLSFASNDSCAFKNKCATGLTGHDCKLDINECLHFPCKHGSCVNSFGSFKCNCEIGWMGSKCDKNINECERDKSLCTKLDNSAICTDTDGFYQCDCSSGYEGENCENFRDACLNHDCSVNQVCVNTYPDYVCICQSEYEMVLTEEGEKVCEARFQETEDACTSRPCGRNGICTVKDSGDFECACKSGWKGETCQMDINECSEKNACNANGKCTNSQGSYSCKCFKAYQGSDCEYELLRLVHPKGKRRRYGRLEVREAIDHEWSTVCDDGWDKDHADIVCNMLGFKRSQKALRRGWIGSGTILISNPQCPNFDADNQFGNSLFDCEYDAKNQCTHSEDVGLVCVKDKLVM